MEDLIGSLSSSSDDDSGPIVIMPPSFHRGIASDDMIDNHHPRIITDVLDDDLLENRRRQFIIPDCLDELIDRPSIENQSHRTMTDGLDDSMNLPAIENPFHRRRRRNNHRHNNQRNDFDELRSARDDQYIQPVRQVNTIKDMLRWTHSLSSGVIPTCGHHEVDPNIDPNSFDEEVSTYLYLYFQLAVVSLATTVICICHLMSYLTYGDHGR